MATLPPKLLQLPPELLVRISSNLTTPQLGDFRRICKHVEAVLFKVFAKEFFTKRQFMLEQVSLQALIDIANHPTLSKQLSEVIISTHAFPEDPFLETERGHANYYAKHVTRDVLLQTGEARDMLVEAFSKLPSLQKVGLRDYDGKDRLRDGKHAMWRSYGWSFGTSAPTHGYRQLRTTPPDTIFPLLLYTLGKANAKPKSIEVFLRKRPLLAPVSFNVLDGSVSQAVIPVLVGLKTAMLAIGGGHLPQDRQFFVGDESSKETLLPLKRFLCCTDGLETLRLNFDPHQMLSQGFLAWLGRTADEIAVPHPKPVQLLNLTSLDLGMLSVHGPTLVTVLTKFPSLISISLWKVTLLPKQGEDRNTKGNSWASVFAELSNAVPVSTRLRTFMVGFLYEGQPGPLLAVIHHMQVAKDSDEATKKDGSKVEDKAVFRAGSERLSIQGWLKELAERMVGPDTETEDDSDTPTTSEEDDVINLVSEDEDADGDANDGADEDAEEDD